MRAVPPSGWGWCCASDAGMHGRRPARLDSGRSTSVKPGQALQINPLRADCVPFRVEPRTDKEHGDRHPKIRDRAFIAAGATVLGNIEIGFGATVGAGSVVLEPVPPYATVVGVPARILCTNGPR
ncbi:TPA: hypothetical protein VDV27_005551 [Pseudomonas aeruginosa]|nr:hypothetical protein [Pseudomonas aeruginosa]